MTLILDPRKLPEDQRKAAFQELGLDEDWESDDGDDGGEEGSDATPPRASEQPQSVRP